MFRPTARRSRLGYVPVRVAASVFMLFVLLLVVAAFVWVQYERYRLLGSEPDRTVGSGALLALPWEDAVKVLNYHAIPESFERVKSLMRNILQSIPTGVLTLDPRGSVTSLNSAAECLLGLRASAIVGRRLDELQVSPDLVAWIRDALRGEQLLQEADLTLALDGGRRVTVRASASELRDDAGRSEGLVILLRDITEVNRLGMQLRRADTLAALGTLAAGVAHEVKNPLHALSLNLHLLEKDVTAVESCSADVREYFTVLRSEMQRIHRIVVSSKTSFAFRSRQSGRCS